MDIDRIREILEKIKNIKIAVYGDYCLDVYWSLDPQGSEISVETGLKAQAVSRQSYTLGGASNIIANLAALNPAVIQAIGVIGDDVYGRELICKMDELNVDISNIIIQKDAFDTVAYCKPYLGGEEQSRIDFGIYNKRSEATDNAILKGIKQALNSSDVLIINQQVYGSITSELFIERLNDLFDEFNNKIILLDSRHYGSKFRNVYRKTNDYEAARLNGIEASPDDILKLSDIKLFASSLYNESNKPVFISRGQRGLLIHDSAGQHDIPGIQLWRKIDTVGAGDTTTSALACCLASGINPDEAGQFANFAAAVTVQKLFQTGTASGEEILNIAKSPDYIYHPELAEDIRQAFYFNSSDIELCASVDIISEFNISHAVFDHDGTISVLREGWESVMESVMIRAILGDKYDSADETLYHKVHKRICDYINKYTGIQTILQMESLVEIVKEFRIVPEDKVLDKFGYKDIYNTALMEMVDLRIKKLARGELNVEDYIIKGAISFIRKLRDRGVTLYLASGTDRNDVISEAKAMGYSELFNGGIYGSVGDVKKYSKKLVIENILRDNSLSGSELVCIGDGPVEIRECRRYGGIAIGIASNEIRRHGLNNQKRTRLIKAGTHLIMPDFSQSDILMQLLFKR